MSRPGLFSGPNETCRDEVDVEKKRRRKKKKISHTLFNSWTRHYNLIDELPFVASKLDLLSNLNIIIHFLL